jgi:hypothetical protein
MLRNSPKHLEKLRGWWWHRQGLSARTALSPAGVLQQTGWVRSVGGCGAYLTLFSRSAISREMADEAIANLEIHELPSARACTSVVPADDYGLALTLAQGFGSGDLRVAEKLGVTVKEIEALCLAVLASLKNGPLTPDEIRQASGSTARSLGAEGQKKGISSTLPLALGQLQRAGEIRRISTNGRLDQQRYKYALWRPPPKLAPPEFAMAELAKRFFTWAAPARLSDFQVFAGVSAKVAKSAVETLKLEPTADDLLLPASLRGEFEAFKPGKEPQYHLLTSLDSLLLLRNDPAIFLDPKDRGHPLLARPGAALIELPSPAILDRGRLVGLWEYDPERESIAYTAFGKKEAALKKAVAETEDYVRTQLGDARTFSLDSPKSRAPRIEALRKLG